MSLVKVNHTGSTKDTNGTPYFYTAGEKVDLPDDVLKALGKDNYSLIVANKEEAPKEQTNQSKEEVKQETPKK